MSIRGKIAIIAAAGARFAAKLLGRGGTSLPGEVALKIEPNLPQKLLAGEDVILITGTNGKTSTLHFLAKLYEGLGHDVVANWSGANLVYGITAAVLAAKKKNGKRIYIFEIDEAHLAKYGKLLNPSQIIITNLHPDQSDRYGSVLELREKMRQGILRIGRSCQLFLAASDPQLAVIGNNHPELSFYFGKEVSSELAAEIFSYSKNHEAPENCFDSLSEADSESCPACGCELRYFWHEYGGNGGYACSNCDLHWLLPDLTFDENNKLYNHVTSNRLPRNQAVADSDSLEKPAEVGQLELPVPGRHNVLNACAALLPLLVRGHRLEELLPLLTDVKAPFGRMESFDMNGQAGQMILLKNPVGMETALAEASRYENLGSVVLYINKRENDGRDDSWLKQSELAERLPTAVKEGTVPLIIGGESRALLEQLLQQANIPFTVAENETAAIEMACEAAGDKLVLFLPNYSAMLDIRKLLVERFGLAEFWEK
ncbi:MAG: MurT ligase domain-containing protein [Eubacteriales bacterium]|nr:MurT ligase domain-containing protein [Eubacteriales bacterium]